MKWLSLVKNLAPFILASVPGVPAAIIPLVVHGIEEAQQLPGASGAEKKAHVLDLVATGTAAVNVAKGKPIVDGGAITSAVSQGIDTTVSVVNLIHAQHVDPPKAG